MPPCCAGEYRDLCSRLAALEAQSRGAPLVSVSDSEAQQEYDPPGGAAGWESDETEEGSGEEGGGGEGAAGSLGLPAAEAAGGRAPAEDGQQASARAGWDIL